MTKAEIDRVLQLFVRFIGNDGLLLTGGGLAVIADVMRRQIQSTPEGQETKLLDYWDAQLDGFRAALARGSTLGIFQSSGRDIHSQKEEELTLITDRAASAAKRRCAAAPHLL